MESKDEINKSGPHIADTIFQLPWNAWGRLQAKKNDLALLDEVDAEKREQIKGDIYKLRAYFALLFVMVLAALSGGFYLFGRSQQIAGNKPKPASTQSGNPIGSLAESFPRDEFGQLIEMTAEMKHFANDLFGFMGYPQDEMQRLIKGKMEDPKRNDPLLRSFAYLATIVDSPGFNTSNSNPLKDFLRDRGKLLLFSGGLQDPTRNLYTADGWLDQSGFNINHLDYLDPSKETDPIAKINFQWYKSAGVPFYRSADSTLYVPDSGFESFHYDDLKQILFMVALVDAYEHKVGGKLDYRSQFLADFFKVKLPEPIRSAGSEFFDALDGGRVPIPDGSQGVTRISEFLDLLINLTKGAADQVVNRPDIKTTYEDWAQRRRGVVVANANAVCALTLVRYLLVFSDGRLGAVKPGLVKVAQRPGALIAK